jgi:hypothetical protein
VLVVLVTDPVVFVVLDVGPNAALHPEAITLATDASAIPYS